MSIDFSPERWEKIKKTYDLWWESKLDRPVIGVCISGKAPGRPSPANPLLAQSNCMDLSVSPEAIIDRIDYELSQIVYLGDAYPYFNLDCFGPGVAAAFCGAKMDNSSGGVWFSAAKQVPITDLHLEYDADNVWLNRIKEICRAGMERWQGQVLLGMADLGGTLDILASLLTPESLMMDFYDQPGEVTRLVWEVHNLWLRFYDEINAVLQPVNPGYSDWSSIYSGKPCYIMQCDFSYMISPKMFDEFVKPDLKAMCDRIPNTFYHLDGVGELPHLKSLLEIEKLKGVQWVPGDGKPNQTQWPEIYQAIRGAGKLTQVWEGFETVRVVGEQTGSLTGIHHRLAAGSGANENEIRKQLQRFGID